MDRASEGGENGHAGMDDSRLARAGVCPTHAVVTPVVINDRWHCPDCGVFIRKQEKTGLAQQHGASEGALDEIFRRLELRRTLESIMATLSALPDSVRCLVDHGTVTDWIEYAVAGHMILPLAEFEKAFQRITQRASRLTKASYLFQDIEAMEAEQGALAEELERLGSSRASLQATVTTLEGKAETLSRSLRAAEKATGMPQSTIVVSLGNLTAAREEASRLSSVIAWLGRESADAGKNLNYLRWEIYRTDGELRRIRDLETEAFETLASRLTVNDVFRLFDRVQLRELRELELNWLKRSRALSGN